MDKIPDIGDLVGYKDGKYRVTGWLLDITDAPINSGCTFTDEIMEELRAETRAEYKQKNIPYKIYQWCLPEEATHVSLTGTCGAIAPISEVIITGKIDWPEEWIIKARKQMIEWGKRKQLLR